MITNKLAHVREFGPFIFSKFTELSRSHALSFQCITNLANAQDIIFMNLRQHLKQWLNLDVKEFRASLLFPHEQCGEVFGNLWKSFDHTPIKAKCFQIAIKKVGRKAARKHEAVGRTR